MNAVYAGSFDPFTNGHLDVICEASKMFNFLFVVIANNPAKQRHYDVYQMQCAIQRIVDALGLTNVWVGTCDTMIVDFCHSVNASYLVRGLRNTSDYVYEENIALINKELDPNIRTLYIRASNNTLSSSMIREFLKYGKDVKQYVPDEIFKQFLDKEKPSKKHCESWP